MDLDNSDPTPTFAAVMNFLSPATPHPGLLTGFLFDNGQVPVEIFNATPATLVASLSNDLSKIQMFSPKVCLTHL
jgi:hypothetical protein